MSRSTDNVYSATMFEVVLIDRTLLTAMSMTMTPSLRFTTALCMAMTSHCNSSSKRPTASLLMMLWKRRLVM